MIFYGIFLLLDFVQISFPDKIVLQIGFRFIKSFSKQMFPFLFILQQILHFSTHNISLFISDTAIILMAVTSLTKILTHCRNHDSSILGCVWEALHKDRWHSRNSWVMLLYNFGRESKSIGFIRVLHNIYKIIFNPSILFLYFTKIDAN